MESFFAIHDGEIEGKLHLQSPWSLRMELNRAKMIDRKLTMAYIADGIAESFKTDLFIIWSEDNSEKLIIRCRVLGGAGKDDEEAQSRRISSGEHTAQLRESMQDQRYQAHLPAGAIW